MRLDDRSVCLAVLDVDHFKRINDAHGHPGGDQALKEIAHRLREQARSGDVIARVGGEEFAWLLVDTEAPSAQSAVERARACIGVASIEGLDRVTLSIGLCALESSMTAQTAYQTADQALYTAKRAGRDRTVLAASTQRVPEALVADRGAVPSVG